MRCSCCYGYVALRGALHSRRTALYGAHNERRCPLVGEYHALLQEAISAIYLPKFNNIFRNNEHRGRNIVHNIEIVDHDNLRGEGVVGGCAIDHEAHDVALGAVGVALQAHGIAQCDVALLTCGDGGGVGDVEELGRGGVLYGEGYRSVRGVDIADMLRELLAVLEVAEGVEVALEAQASAHVEGVEFIYRALAGVDISRNL